MYNHSKTNRSTVANSALVKVPDTVDVMVGIKDLPGTIVFVAVNTFKVVNPLFSISQSITALFCACWRRLWNAWCMKLCSRPRLCALIRNMACTRYDMN